MTHVERAACYLGLAQYEKALADANEALALGISCFEITFFENMYRYVLHFKNV